MTEDEMKFIAGRKVKLSDSEKGRIREGFLKLITADMRTWEAIKEGLKDHANEKD